VTFSRLVSLLRVPLIKSALLKVDRARYRTTGAGAPGAGSLPIIGVGGMHSPSTCSIASRRAGRRGVRRMRSQRRRLVGNASADWAAGRLHLARDRLGTRHTTSPNGMRARKVNSRCSAIQRPVLPQSGCSTSAQPKNHGAVNSTRLHQSKRC
jgi:hypothetical protein